MVRCTLTSDYIKSILDYNESTGIWTWVRPTSNRVQCGDIAGRVMNNGYRYIHINGQSYAAHRLAFLWVTGNLPKQDVDHINGIKLDNSWNNLRDATRSQNLFNRSAYRTNILGIKNVSQKDGKYRVRLSVNGVQKQIGIYEDLELAQLVAIEARNLYHGKFANS